MATGDIRPEDELVISVLGAGSDVCLWPDGQWRLYRPSTDERNPVTDSVRYLKTHGYITFRWVRGVRTAELTAKGKRGVEIVKQRWKEDARQAQRDLEDFERKHPELKGR